MIAVNFIAFIISIRHGRRKRELHLITYYIAAALLLDFIWICVDLLIVNKFLAYKIIGISLNTFLIVEITLLFTYLHTNISSKKLKTITKIIYCSFFVFLSFCFIKYPSVIVHSSNYILAIESFCIFVPCLFYFYELIKTSQQFILKNHPTFWIITGILFYNSTVIPGCVLINYFDSNLPTYSNILWAVNYTLYTILFLLFIKGYTCKKETISI